MPHLEDCHVMRVAVSGSPSPSKTSQDAAVAHALEIARESPDSFWDSAFSNILEKALTQIWDQVQAHPCSYVMSRGQFAVFNFFQHRFIDNKDAIATRKRYWDKFHA
ncbi:hypothetical protein MY8738_008520 [Beauveria namnaoensis]